MRPISRTALEAATTAALAVTAIAPSAAAPQDDATARKPLTGSSCATSKAGELVTVTLVTGDKVLVRTDSSGAASVTALPREDGSVPLLQTRQSDLAWAAGYTGKGTRVAVPDTGADAEPLDLKGRIAASENFTDSSTADDRQGHGTHTISTVGGSGAASDGRKKGIAPDTELLNGKVLNDGGSGAVSWITAGMQWAVDQEADVVSMSLGSSEPTDCTDPMSVAAEKLARSEDTLFVIAEGNSGPRHNTVSSPGCAPSVLTVGAVDRDDSTAQFSSCGPAIGAHTLKPEIAAPCVGGAPPPGAGAARAAAPDTPEGGRRGGARRRRGPPPARCGG
ncbi:S8 family serine peptidase, partial [Streptomyces sp. NPDC002476]|uniref:S8 family serine peptidase n=1 Tax=Streptomyces sp. NPDC002476 TaxID=3364648 RepID=UPI0036C04C1F